MELEMKSTLNKPTEQQYLVWQGPRVASLAAADKRAGGFPDRDLSGNWAGTGARTGSDQLIAGDSTVQVSAGY